MADHKDDRMHPAVIEFFRIIISVGSGFILGGHVVVVAESQPAGIIVGIGVAIAAYFISGGGLRWKKRRQE